MIWYRDPLSQCILEQRDQLGDYKDAHYFNRKIDVDAFLFMIPARIEDIGNVAPPHSAAPSISSIFDADSYLPIHLQIIVRMRDQIKLASGATTMFVSPLRMRERITAIPLQF